MQPAIMQNEKRLVVFNDEARRRLSVANQAIRHVRTRADLPRISQVILDSDRPVILLAGLAPELILEAATFLRSQKMNDEYLVRGLAFGCEWSWFSACPAVYVSRKIEQRPAPLPRELPHNVVTHPLFGGELLRTAGAAR